MNEAPRINQMIKIIFEDGIKRKLFYLPKKLKTHHSGCCHQETNVNYQGQQIFLFLIRIFVLKFAMNIQF